MERMNIYYKKFSINEFYNRNTNLKLNEYFLYESLNRYSYLNCKSPNYSELANLVTNMLRKNKKEKLYSDLNSYSIKLSNPITIKDEKKLSILFNKVKTTYQNQSEELKRKMNDESFIKKKIEVKNWIENKSYEIYKYQNNIGRIAYDKLKNFNGDDYYTKLKDYSRVTTVKVNNSKIKNQIQGNLNAIYQETPKYFLEFKNMMNKKLANFESNYLPKIKDKGNNVYISLKNEIPGIYNRIQSDNYYFPYIKNSFSNVVSHENLFVIKNEYLTELYREIPEIFNKARDSLKSCDIWTTLKTNNYINLVYADTQILYTSLQTKFKDFNKDNSIAVSLPDKQSFLNLFSSLRQVTPTITVIRKNEDNK